MALTKRLRFEVMRRDGHACRYCGATVEDGVKLHVDHVVPVALGGSDDPENLATACADCNNGKSSTSLDDGKVADIATYAADYAAAMEQAAKIRRAERTQVVDAHERALDEFDEAWAIWTYKCSNAKCEETHYVPMDDEWRRSIGHFVDQGLDTEDLTYFIGVAMRSKAKLNEKFRYFCGCCWNEIKDRQELAGKIARGDA